MVEKVSHINELRAKKSIDIVAKGGTALDPYTFDYLLLCNKICGASHYNMQMKIVVDTPEDYKKWVAEQALLAQQVKEAKAAPADATGTASATTDTVAVKDTIAVSVIAKK